MGTRQESSGKSRNFIPFRWFLEDARASYSLPSVSVAIGQTLARALVSTPCNCLWISRSCSHVNYSRAAVLSPSPLHHQYFIWNLILQRRKTRGKRGKETGEGVRKQGREGKVGASQSWPGYHRPACSTHSSSHLSLIFTPFAQPSASRGEGRSNPSPRASPLHHTPSPQQFPVWSSCFLSSLLQKQYFQNINRNIYLLIKYQLADQILLTVPHKLQSKIKVLAGVPSALCDLNLPAPDLISLHATWNIRFLPPLGSIPCTHYTFQHKDFEFGRLFLAQLSLSFKVSPSQRGLPWCPWWSKHTNKLTLLTHIHTHRPTHTHT